MGTKIVLAVSSKLMLDDLKEVGVRNILVSYYYIKKTKFDWKPLLKQFDFVMIDSGAHTFKEAFGLGVTSASRTQRKGREVGAGVELKNEEEREKYIDDYLNDYANWLVENSDCYDVAVELDIDEIVGTEKCEKYRQVLIDKGVPKEKIMPVFHTQVKDTLEDWEKWCGEFKYIGVSEGGDVAKWSWNSLLQTAKKYKTKIHGLATTRYDMVTKYPLFSVDSTSWLAGNMYGVTYYMRGNKIYVCGKDGKQNIRSRCEPLCKKWNINFENFMSDKPKEVSKFNAGVWAEWNDKLNENKVQDYWLLKEERKRVGGMTKEETAKALASIKDMTPVQASKILQESVFRKMKTKCSECYIADKCALFEEGSYCKIGQMLEIKDGGDLNSVVSMLISAQVERVLKEMYIEKLEGGKVDPVLTGEMMRVFEMIKAMKEVTKDQVDISVKGEGVLSKLFGKDVMKEQKEEKSIEAEEK